MNQPTLLQSIFLQNDPLIDQRLAESGWLEELSQQVDAGEKIDQAACIRTAWLRTVGRPPSQRELQRASKHLARVDSLREGMQDLLWALLNTKEFVLNR